MARQPRFNLPGYPQHVIIRGNNREPVFFSDGDYTFFLRKLREAIVQHPCELHAYVLMSNHVHFLISPLQDKNLSKVMQSIGRVYVQQFNRLYGRTGTLWEGRYKATVVDSDNYALACYRYIELNPVRAEMVDDPAKYPWSSYRYNALGEENVLITPHSLYLSLSKNECARHQSYRTLFDHDMPEKLISEIREMTNKSWVLGSDRFAAGIQAKLSRPVLPRSKGGDRRSKAYQDINRV